MTDTPPVSAKAKRILIVEDEKALAHVLELKLQYEGYETVTVPNGADCYTLVTTQRFDVMLLDLMMPTVDGFSVLEQLKGVANKPIIFTLSNLRQREDEKRTRSLGVSKHFSKAGVQLETIVEEIKKYIEAPHYIT